MVGASAVSSRPRPIRLLGSETVLVDRLVEALLDGEPSVVVDLRDAPMVSSTVLTALRRAGKTLRARGGDLTVRASHPGLVRLLEMTLLNASFTLEGRDAGA